MIVYWFTRGFHASQGVAFFFNFDFAKLYIYIYTYILFIFLNTNFFVSEINCWYGFSFAKKIVVFFTVFVNHLFSFSLMLFFKLDSLFIFYFYLINDFVDFCFILLTY